MIKICNRIIEYSFYSLFFLVPLVIANDTSELFEFNKMWLTFGLTLIIGAAWGTKMILQRRIFIQKTPLDIPILLFLLSQFIATIFSWDTHVSFWGYYSRFNGGFLSTIAYIFLYYAFVSNLGNLVNRFLFVSLFSGLVVALWGLPSHFGYDPTCLIFRGELNVSCWTEDFQPKVRIFSTLGQPAWLAAYLAILLPISITMFIKFIKNLPLSIFYLLVSALFYLDLLYTQARSGILAVWLSLAIFAVGYILVVNPAPLLGVEKWCGVKRQFLKLSALLTVILSITFFIGTPFPQLNRFTLNGIKAQFTKNTIENAKKTTQKQAQPNHPQHTGELGGTDSGKIRKIVWNGAINIWKQYPLFGTGVETFAFAYYRHKPAAQNLTSEWNFLYNKAHNEYLNYLATTGAFGLGTYLLMIGFFLVRSLFFVMLNSFQHLSQTGFRNKFGMTENKTLTLALLASYISILVTNFFGFSVVITNIYLFMIPSFVFILNGMIDEEKQFILPSFPKNQSHKSQFTNHNSQISYYQWTFVIVLLFAICYLLFTLFMFWFADKNYAFGYNLDRAGEYEKAYPYLHKAVRLRDEPVFKDELAVNDAMFAVAILSQKDSGGNKEDLIAKANVLIQEAIETSDQLTADHENNVVFWKSRTRIFYTLSQVDPQYLLLAQQAIEKAAELAPTDASISYNLGVLYGQNDDIKNGIQTLENTVRLKPDYKDAHYALSLFYHQEAIDKNGRIVNSALQKKAIREMQYILDHLIPNDPAAIDSLKAWKQ